MATGLNRGEKGRENKLAQDMAGGVSKTRGQGGGGHLTNGGKVWSKTDLLGTARLWRCCILEPTNSHPLESHPFDDELK